MARRIATASFRWAIAFAERLPCFQLALRLRSKPSDVRGPVLFPPCSRQRPFAIAGPLQGVPHRVLAPQRGATLAAFSAVRQSGT